MRPLRLTHSIYMLRDLLKEIYAGRLRLRNEANLWSSAEITSLLDDLACNMPTGEIVAIAGRSLCSPSMSAIGPLELPAPTDCAQYVLHGSQILLIVSAMFLTWDLDDSPSVLAMANCGFGGAERAGFFDCQAGRFINADDAIFGKHLWTIRSADLLDTIAFLRRLRWLAENYHPANVTAPSLDEMTLRAEAVARTIADYRVTTTVIIEPSDDQLDAVLKRYGYVAGMKRGYAC